MRKICRNNDDEREKTGSMGMKKEAVASRKRQKKIKKEKRRKGGKKEKIHVRGHKKRWRLVAVMETEKKSENEA